MKKRKISFFAITLIILLQTICIYSVSGQTVKITKFTQSPANPVTNQSVLFRVRTEGDVENVYMSIDGEKEINFNQKSNNIWETEKKLTIEGTRYIKVTAVGKDGSKDSITDTMEVKAKETTVKVSETVTEATTERVYTGNIEKSSEAETETELSTAALTYSDFDGGEYNEESPINEVYFELSRNEDMDFLNSAAGASVFMFVGESSFINKWQKEPIDPDNPNTSSYIKDGYTLVPLRAISTALGAAVSWDADTKTADISLSGKNISITVGSNLMKVGDTELNIEARAEVNEGRVFVPLRAIAESFNKNVYYKDKFIGITSTGMPLTDNGFELIRQAALIKFS